MLTSAKIRKSTRQLSPKVGIVAAAPAAAIIGARKEAMAFTNWPKVRVEASLSPEIRLVTRGLSDVCIMALPMPRSEKAMSIV